MFTANHDKWTLEEKIRLLELYIDKDSGVWEDRANTLQTEFAGKRPADFFTQTTVRRELNNIFNKPNPEHHISGLPTHPRGKEAAELWLKHFRRQIEEGRVRRKELFMVAMRKQLDLIRRYQRGGLPKEELDALLEEARERDAQRPDKEQYEAKIKQHMAKAYIADVKNVRSFVDYFRFLRGVRIPTPARSPTPAKMLDTEFGPKITVQYVQDTTDGRKNVAEPTDFPINQESMPGIHIVIAPQKLNTRKRRHDVSDDIDTDLEKPSEKRLRRTSKTVTEQESEASFALETFTSSVCISLDKQKEHPPFDGESEARINLRPLPQFETVGLQTRVPKYAEANEKCFLTKSGPEAFNERIFPIREMKCIENGNPIVAKGRKKEFDAKDNRKSAAELPDASTKQQRISGTQLAATPPSQKPNTRKRKNYLYGEESKDTIAEPSQPSEKRAKISIKKEPVDDKSASSSTLSSPMTVVATPPQPLISEVAATAKLRSQLRRAAVASATPSPAVDSIADNRLFLKPGRLSSTEAVPKQILLTLWRDIHSHRHASVFSYPVSEEHVRGYHSAIKKPMDLRTLKTNIESGRINTLGQFSHAILKMFANAVMYNSTGHYVNNYAKEMGAYAMKCIEVVQFPGGQFQVPPPSRHSNGSSSEGGVAGGTSKFPIAWATTLIKPKGVTMCQKTAKGRNDDDKMSMSSSQETNEEEATHSNEDEARRIFQRCRLSNKKYTFPAVICSNLD